MRRVVVTGLGMVTPLGCGVDTNLEAHSRQPERRRGRSRRSMSPISPARSPASCRAATALTAPSIPTSGWSRRTSARSTISSSSRCARRVRRSTMPTGIPRAKRTMRHRHPDRVRHRRPVRHRRYSDPSERARTAQGVAVLHSRPPDQSRFGLCLDRARPEGSEPFGGDGLFDRCACDRRCQSRLIALGDADVMVAGGTESPICRIGMAGFCAARALSTGFNETPQKGLAPLRQGPRRLRDGRGRRHRGARGI